MKISLRGLGIRDDLLSLLLLAGASVSLLLAAANVYAQDFVRAQTLEDAFKASCRVSVNGARGTGTFVGYDKEHRRAVVLTNYHVVTRNENATLDFWTNGVRESVAGKVFARFYDVNRPADFALIAVNPDDLARINPPYVALAGADGAPSENSYIISAGCPKGRFVQAWKGKTLGYYRGRTIEFKPGPVPGQSGSGVLSYVDGELWLTAVLTWLIGSEGSDDSTGGAIPISILYDCLAGQSPAADSDSSPIPPGAKECLLNAANQSGNGVNVARAPCVLMFTQPDCPPCVEAERDVELLRALNVPVYVYDVTTERGAEYAKRYKIDRTPTFVLTDSKYAPVQTVVGAGKAEEIRQAFATLTPAPTPAPDEPTLESPETIPVNPAPPVNLAPLPLEPKTDNALESDFRNRPAVYEVHSDVGFFEDSDSRWQELKRKREQRRSEEPPADDGETQKQTRPRLGERLTDGAIDAITARIENAANQKIEDIKAAMKEKWEACKFVLLMGFCLILAVALLVAQGIVAVVKWVWKKAVEINAVIQSAKEKEESR